MGARKPFSSKKKHRRRQKNMRTFRCVKNNALRIDDCNWRKLVVLVGGVFTFTVCVSVTHPKLWQQVNEEDGYNDFPAVWRSHDESSDQP